MSDETRCRWCGGDLGPHRGYCSAHCLQEARADLFNRPRTIEEIRGDVKWQRFCAEIPPELADMLDAAQRKSMGVNAPQATRAGMVRAALLMYLNATSPAPEPWIEGTADEVVEQGALEAGD